MNEKLRNYVEGLFENAPKTKQAVEIKEEILQNTVDRYNDLIAEGKTEEAAYNISIAGIGNIEHIIGNIAANDSYPTYSKQEIEKNKKQRSLLLSIAVGLYICSVIPPILFSDVWPNDTLGILLMFVIIAIATGIIIYRSGTALNYNTKENTVAEDFKEWNSKNNEKKSVVKAINAAIWSVTLVAYFLLSFLTGKWAITWITFLIGAAVTNIINAVFDIKK